MPESGYFRGIVILPYYSDFDTVFDVYIESDMSLNSGDTVKVRLRFLYYEHGGQRHAQRHKRYPNFLKGLLIESAQTKCGAARK